MNQEEKNKKNQSKPAYNEEMEDVTQYGEFVSSYFAWVPLKKQKDRVEELENMTQEDERE